jgi:hypothetical protein
MPDWAKTRKYITFRIVSGVAWFYDAWTNYARALEQALEIDGQIIPIEEVDTDE